MRRESTGAHFTLKLANSGMTSVGRARFKSPLAHTCDVARHRRHFESLERSANGSSLRVRAAGESLPRDELLRVGNGPSAGPGRLPGVHLRAGLLPASGSMLGWLPALVNRGTGRNSGRIPAVEGLACKDGGPVVLDTNHGPPVGLSLAERLLGPNPVVELSLCVVMQGGGAAGSAGWGGE